MAYKLVEYAGQPRLNLSSEKENWPGRKQVFRQMKGGRMDHAMLARCDEVLDGEPLLVLVMRQGRRLTASETSLEDARRHAQTEMDRLPDHLRQLQTAPAYAVQASQSLEQKRKMTQQKLTTSP